MDIRAQPPLRSSQPPGSQRSHVGLVRMVSLPTLVVFILAIPLVVQAKTFQCPGGDVTCLIAAITEAHSASGKKHEIRLAAGTYTVTTVNNETDGRNGLPSITRNITIRGVGASSTIIERGTGGPGFRLWHVAETGWLTLQGVTSRGGEASFGGEGGEGGGIYNRGGRLTLIESTLAGNEAFAGGGLSTNGGTVTITSSTVSDNGANGGGGAILNRGGTLVITHATFARNLLDSAGGSIFNQAGQVTITHTSFTHEFAGLDGGVLINFQGIVTISDSTLANVVAGGHGAALNNREGTVTLTNTTISDNVSGGEGGGLVNTGLLIMTNSTIARNHASSKGALLNVGTATITNCTIAGHTASSSGNEGGGIYNLGTVELQNTILALNSIESGRGPDCFGVLTSLGHNLIGNLTDCTVALVEGDLTGAPGLGTFTTDGLPGHGHFPLLSTSRAINAGDDAACPPTDQLGHARVGICDIGAIEFQP